MKSFINKRPTWFVGVMRRPLIWLGKLAYKISRHLLGCSARDCCKAYLFFDRIGRQDMIEKGKRLHSDDVIETWRQFYTRLYGFEPDWIKYSPSLHWDEVHNPPDITGIIKAEEEKYHKLRARNEKLIRGKFADATKLDGQTLAKLHHTYGCDPSMIEDILGTTLPERLHDDYQLAYSQHRRTGAGGV